MEKNPSEKQAAAAKALELLDQAWAYYMPEPNSTQEQHEPELFEYANAA
ncbi:hypothetical protein [Ruegeria lacuscaerulensis]|nr:hypothetical protein [Ruegeria lacuscaerulensis]